MEFSEWDANVNVVDAQGNLLCEKLSKYPALGIRPTIRVSKNALLNVTGRVNIPAFKLANTPKSYSPATRLIRGDIITFGKAEQDGNAKNGKEAIRWIVLDVRDGKALLVSRSILYCWDTSGEGYEEFLNDKFYKNAFSDSEKANIILTENQTDEPDINWGEFSYTISSVRTKKTRDRVFILSDNELGRYFPDNASRYATATAEANKQSYSEYGIENYITRNISWIVCDESAANVSWLYSQHGGAFYTGLRPAIWVKTSADMNWETG